MPRWNHVAASQAPTAVHELWGIGSNTYGSVGTTPPDQQTFVRVGEALWRDMDAYVYGGVGVTAAGEFMHWGYNLITSQSRYSPTPMGTASDWVACAACNYNGFALDSAGALWVTGVATSGLTAPGWKHPSPGTAHSVGYLSPAAGGHDSFVRIEANGFGSVALLKADGSLWAFGSNSYGQCAFDTTVATVFEPERIGTGTDWTDIAVGTVHMLGIAGGKLYGWGRNNVYQLGLGDTATRSVPTRIGTAANWTNVGCTGNSSFAINALGELLSWGEGASYKLGNGSAANVSTPSKLGGLSWRRIAKGHQGVNIAAGITIDGQLRFWGTFGGITYASPTLLSQATGWVDAAINFFAINALKEAT